MSREVCEARREGGRHRCVTGWTFWAERVWQLPLHQSQTFWDALVKSRYARPIALLQPVLRLGHERLDLEQVLRMVLTPAVVLCAIEALVHAGQLHRVQAAHITESLLVLVDRHGCWRGEPWDGTVRATTMAPDVVRFAEVGRVSRGTPVRSPVPS